jgi:protein-tyrosine phosphatase
MTFTVLFVCTGNICRSPMAEALFRARVDPALPIVAASAGTTGLTGWGMDQPSAIVLRQLGGEPDGHSAQRLTRDLIASSDLILTAETTHRDAVIGADPSARDRAYTMREFGRIGAGLQPLPEPPTADTLRARVAEVAARRAAEAPARPRYDDIGDPYAASFDLVQICGGQIASAVDASIAALGMRRADARVPNAPT